jgi:hypothetical protein
MKEEILLNEILPKRNKISIIINFHSAIPRQGLLAKPYNSAVH